MSGILIAKIVFFPLLAGLGNWNPLEDPPNLVLVGFGLINEQTRKEFGSIPPFH